MQNMIRSANMNRTRTRFGGVMRALAAAAVFSVLLLPLSTASAQNAQPRVFPTPEAAVQALADAAKAGSLNDLLAIFGADGQDVAASSDPTTARQNREIFTVA